MWRVLSLVLVARVAGADPAAVKRTPRTCSPAGGVLLELDQLKWKTRTLQDCLDKPLAEGCN